MRNVLFFDRDHCLACRSCELACAVAHSLSGRLESAMAEANPPRRRVTMAAGKDGIEALRCEQCAEPLCAFACKSGALRRDPFTGRVVFDDARCVGCFMCLMVCATGVRANPSTGRVVRCDACEGLATPACVAACPTKALAVRPAGEEPARSDFAGHVVVVGSSAAGIAACEAARETAPGCSITLVTRDTLPQYSRPLLAYVLAGSIERSGMTWRPEGYLDNQLRVSVLSGRKAVALASGQGPLVLDDGTELAFDRLVIATGARAAPLTIPGATLEGVCSLRDLGDLEAIADLAGSGRRAVILGGGNVGLQASEALLARGTAVTIVVASSHLLSQMVDAEAGRRVGELFARRGVCLLTNRDAVEIIGSARVEGVRLDNGDSIAADLVLVAKGIRPNVEWLCGSDVRIGRGIVVDRCGRTSAPGVFAAGDCAETGDPLSGRPSISGMWPVAYEMGRAAGSTAVGVDRACAGALRMNASRFFGESIISIGEVRPERLEGATAEVLMNSDGIYRKLVWHGGRLAGALLYGDIANAGNYYRAYREQRVS